MTVTRLVEVYRTPKGWRWRQRDPHNRLVTSASTQAYARRDQALYNLETETGIPVDPTRFKGGAKLEVLAHLDLRLSSLMYRVA